MGLEVGLRVVGLRVVGFAVGLRVVGLEVVGLGEGAAEGFAFGFDVGLPDSEGLALLLGEFDGFALSDGLSDGPEDGFLLGSLVGLEVGDEVGRADGDGVKHRSLNSAMHTCANCKLASMLRALTVTLFPDTVPDHVPPALNFATSSDSA